MKNLIFIIISLFCIIMLCSAIDTYCQDFLISQPGAEVTDQVFYKAFGEFRDYLSDLSYLEADAYFHGEGLRCEGENCTETHLEPAEEHEAEHEHEKENNIPIRSLNPLLNISQAVSISQHRHLPSNQQKEILPWFYFAVKLNPHNESAYSIGGFWLATHINKIDQAIKFLEQGLKNNPESWQIYSQIGEIYILQEKDYPKAAYYFEKARIFADKQNADRFNKRVIYTLLAEAYKQTGKPEQVENLYKQLDNIFPGSQALHKK